MNMTGRYTSTYRAHSSLKEVSIVLAAMQLWQLTEYGRLAGDISSSTCDTDCCNRKESLTRQWGRIYYRKDIR
jgi:hypothetical protein